MSDQSAVISVEDGMKHIKELIPTAVEVAPSSLSLERFEGKETIVKHGDCELKISGQQGKTFRKATGIHFPMLMELNEATARQCWSELVLKKQLYLRVRGNDVVGTSDDAEFPNYGAILDKLVQQLDPIGFANIIWKGDHVGFGLVAKQYQEPPQKRGDTIHEGIYVSFNGDVQAGMYNFRMVCSNGQLGFDRFQKPVNIKDEHMHEQIDDLVLRSRKFTEGFVHLANNRIPNTGAIVGRLSRVGHLNATQVRQISERLSELGDEATEFDLVNLITAMQHDRPNDLTWLTAGGRAVDYLHRDHCSFCGTAT